MRVLSRYRIGAATPLRRVTLDVARVPGVLYGLLLAIATVCIAAFVIAAVFRLSYPFPLEITEAATLRHVERVLRGQPIYVSPTLEHVPLIYGPLYPWFSAAIALIVGPSYAAPRLVSLLASLGSLSLICDLVRHETGSRAAGIVGAGLLAASYPLASGTLDVARVDALFVLFTLAAVYTARVQRPGGRWALLGSGCLVALAGFTKLPLAAAPIGMAIVIYCALIDWRDAAAFLVGVSITAGLLLLALRLQSGPWATWYMWDLPRQHVARANLIGLFWWNDFLPRFTLPLLLGPWFLLFRAVARDWRSLVFYGLTVPALLALAWASRSSSGGAANVLLPAHAVAGLLFGLGLAVALRHLSSSALGVATRGYVVGVCVVQFALLAYNPWHMVPFRSDERADELLAARLAALPGQIFAPDLDAYVRGSEQPEQPNLAAVDELMGNYGGQISAEGRGWASALDAALNERRFSYVVLPDTNANLKGTVLANGYVDAGPLFPPGDEFFALKTAHTPEAHLYTAPGG